MPPDLTLFQQIAATLLIATTLGLVAVLLRQPLIVAFIASGVVAGPSGLGIVHAGEPFNSLAELGIALLLFLVGLRLDPNVLRRIGATATIAGLGQIAITASLGVLAALALGIGWRSAIYIGGALAFSSTVIIVKLLTDQRELDSLHGRITVGILIIQDLLVVAAMMAITVVSSGAAGGQQGLAIVLKLAGFVIALVVVGRSVLPLSLHAVARSTEAVVLFGIAWAVVVATAAKLLGLSTEVGAFLAGVTLASSRYRDAIAGRLVAVRDFMLLFFFLSLGANFRREGILASLPAALGLALFVLLVKPLVVMAIMAILGYRRRTNFLCGVAIAQLSEFSLILASTGLALGHVQGEEMTLLLLVFMISMVPSTYVITRQHAVYGRLANALRIFERKRLRLDADAPTAASPCDVIIFGLGRYGSRIARRLQSAGLRVLGVDFDPEAIAGAREHGIAARYGDAEDPEQLEDLPLESAALVVSAMPPLEQNLAVLSALAHARYGGRIAVTAHSHGDAERLARAGAHLVLAPFGDAADEASDRLLRLLEHAAAAPEPAPNRRSVGGKEP